MSLSLRLFRCVAALLFLYAGVAQAQITIGNATPNPVCAGSPVSFPYFNNLSPFTSTDIFLNGPNTANLRIATLPAGINGSITVTIPADRVSGQYFITATSAGINNTGNSPTFNVVAKPAAPTTSNVTYCQNATATPLTATGQNLKWYNANGNNIGQPTPATGTPGNTTYYVTQTVNGCESDKASITVTVNAPPANPTANNVTYCQNATATPLTASGQGLRWYDANGNLIGQPTPSTTTPGNTTYYVTQTVNGCESGRTSIVVTVVATPPAPSVANTSVAYCQNTTAQQLQATATAGNTLNWYNSQGNLLGSTAPTPQTNNPGTTFYQVSQRSAVGGCESSRVQITVTINAAPAAPATSPVNVCQGGPTVSLVSSVTPVSGNSLKWYTSPTSASLAAAPPVTTSQTGSQVFYVTQINANGCESSRAAITYTVNALPNPPSVVSPVTYCQNATAQPLQATPSPGGTLNFYTVSSGGTSTTSLTPQTQSSNIYYVSQTVNGCESGSRAPITVTINAQPPSPAVTTPVVYCQFATASPLSATAATNNTLIWYALNGQQLGSAPTPPTTVTGTTSYSVSQRDPLTCVSQPAIITVTINAVPPAPATSPVNVCQGGTRVSLVSSVTPVSGNSLKWYTSPTSASLAAAPPVTTSQTGSQVFYVTQVNANGCESSRAAITYTVNPLPSPPVPTPRTVFYCQGATATPLTASGQNLKWYLTNTTSVSATSITPSTDVANNVKYYVSQTNANGCESARDSVTVITGSRPVAPTVISPVTYCQNAVATSLSATAIPTNTLRWYGTDPASTNFTTQATIPATATPGTFTYYVTQTDGNSCESDKAGIVVRVNPLPTTPVTTSITVCQNATTVSLPSAVVAAGTLKWYTAPTGGVGSTTAPVLSTSAATTYTYYVSQTDGNGCESNRATLTATVKPLPAAPTVSLNVVPLCQSSTPTALTAMASTGGTLKWYDPSGNTFASITPSSAVVATTVYQVSQLVDGCEGPKTSVSVVVIRKPDAPTVVVPAAYCQFATPTSLSATGQNLRWYADPTTTQTIPTPTPSTSTSGTTTYYVTQTDLNGCQSDRASIAVQVKAKPAPPVTAPVAFCANQVSALTATASTGGTLNWYGMNQAGGAASATAPVPSTSVVGTPINYYVSQTVDGCESDRAAVAVTIKALPVAPTVSATPVVYCQGVTAQPLSATPATNGTLNWYLTQTGGTSSPTAFTPSTASNVPPTSYYYVSQTVDGCEGPRATIAVTINPKPTTPTVTAAVTYCQNAVAQPLTATASGTLRWYTDPAGSPAIPTPTPSTTTPGVTNYYVTQTSNNGCESDRATIAVTINALPAAPVVSQASVAVCQNSTPVALTATASTGGTLNWYTTINGLPSSTAPAPPTTTAGSVTTYYVSQTVNGCEGPKTAISVTVTPLPAAPPVSTPVTYCQNAVAQPLTATASAGGTLNWYDPTGNALASAAPTPSTTTPGAIVYQVSQTVNGCEGPRASITVNVNQAPVVPTATAALAYCQSSVPPALTATASTGGTLNWYTVATGGTASSVAPIPNTTTAGVQTYYVSQTVNGCESNRVTITVTINPLPAAPTVSQASVAVCQNSTPVALTATASAGGTLNWYTVATGTPSATAPAPPTTAAGSTMTYYVSQTVNGCEGPKTAISVTVTPLPAAPAVSTPINYCQNAVAQPLTATASAGGTLNWYDPTGNALASAAPTPSTTTPGAIVYQVSQTVNGCEGPRASVTVIVNQAPVVPTATAALAYCQNSVAPALMATASTGGMLNWYTVATGGTASSVAPIPNTTTAGVQTYYVSQTVNGCESNRVTITVTINPLPAAPAVSQAAVAVCQNSIPVALTATASTGGTLNWYMVATGGTPSSTAPAPPTTTAGVTMTYYVSQTVNGCEGPKTTISVTVTPLPAAPTVSSPVNYCQNAVAQPLMATASTGGTLNWYSPAGGTASSVALTPGTTTAGQQTYSVSQTVNGCEGPKASITVNIYQAPAVPTTTAALAYCQNAVAPALTATASTGGTINWYTVPTGGTASSVAPVPNTTTAGVQTYYVSQTVNGCESDKVTVTVTIKATPVAPTPVNPTISLCQSGTATPLTAVPSTGGTLNWYTVVGGPASPVAPTPNTNAAGQQTYYVSQTISGCEGPTTPIVVTVNALPAPPVVTAALVSFCQNSPSTALTAQPSPGGTLYWYAGTGGAGSTTAPVPPTNTAGTQTYLVSQRVNGCEGPQATLTVTIHPLPAAPTTSPTPLTYCQGVTALPLTAAGTGTLNWYTTAGGTPSQTAPVPPTTTPGLLTYYVSQTINGCEGPQATIVVLINATPAAPTVGATPVYCQNGTSTALAAIPSSGGALEWYTTPTGGSPSSTPPTPPVGSAGTVTYYVSQNIGGCEGPRVQVTATIKPSPVAPTVTPTLAYCQNSVASALTATPSGGTLNWYTVPTGGTGSATPPVPPTNTVGTQSYYVSQITADGCEGPRATIAVTVRALPAAPTTTPLSICQNATPPSLALSVAAIGPVNWYMAQTGGTPSTVPPVPATANPGPITYYVSQTDANGCESPRSLLLVTVTATPAAPVVPTIAPVCQNTAPIVLTAAGQGLKWYADATSTGSLGSSIVQQTGVAGTFAYYVSQTVGTCEGPRALAQVVVNASPAAPVVQATQSGCQDAPAQPLTASGTALQWYDANDSQIGTPTPDTRVEATQTYSYKVTQTVNGCVSPKATILYTVTALPAPTVTTPVIYCQNQQATPLQASGSGLRWVDPSGAVTNVAPTPSTSVITAGASYSVSQTNAQGCESRKTEIRVTVNAQAVAVLSGTTTVSYGSGALLTLTLSGVGPYSYTLSNGTSGIAESATSATITRTISVTPTATTTYTLLGVSNGCGAGNASGSATVTVDRPAIVAGALSVSSVCAGGRIDVPFTTSGTFTPGNTFVVEMAIAGDSATRQYRAISTGVIQGPVIQTTVPINYAQGLYFIRVRATNTNYPLVSAPSATTLNVRALPTASISASKNVVYRGERVQLNFTFSGDAPWQATYRDRTGVRPISPTTNPYSLTFTADSTTTYKLLSVSNGCGTGRIDGVDSVRVRVDLLTADENPFATSVKVYPVPTNGDVTVEIDDPMLKNAAEIQLTRLSGEVAQTIKTRQRQTVIKLGDEPAGIYFLQIRLGDRSTVRRVLKQ